MKMWRYLAFSLLFALSFTMAACSPPDAPTPSPPVPTPAPTDDSAFASDGGGEPRTAGYWLVWNTCTEGNQSATAKANGGREAGWILLDDLLTDPGIMMGTDELKACQQAAAILGGKLPESTPENDLHFYRLAAALLTAQLNLAIPAESCPAVEQAVQAGQLLLVSVGYHVGDASSLSPRNPEKDSQLADFLSGQLDRYNRGELCR
jgi:hypothetical protein